jgi:starch synthase (maltosyl-transferring)
MEEGRKRVVIETVSPEIDSGRFPIKRVIGEKVIVEADVFADGHDAIQVMLLFRNHSDSAWKEIPMHPLSNDRWRAEFQVTELSRYRYMIEAWVDSFGTWWRDLSKKIGAGEDTFVDYQIGAQLVQAALERALDSDVQKLSEWIRLLSNENESLQKKRQSCLEEGMAEIVSRYPDRRWATRYAKQLAVVVERERARFSAWYEFFPRSCARESGRHGTFRDCEAHLAYVASMGFDVIYFPPIHPIGLTHRKGKNNTPESTSEDVGSPWGIGSKEGGHKSVHPGLGTLADFRRLLDKAREYNIEIALDIAFQCSPDHPYVQEHPEWFRWRPDGRVQYAENPPKKYQDIYPFEFVCEQWKELWEELKSILLFWCEQGVRIFRVDNPHTKPFDFWEWVISEVKKKHVETIFLSEAFTRPKVMYRLAKLGFSQSYTYFTWRNTKAELTQYFTDLNRGELSDFFRPNLWPNTPDILTEYLQYGGLPAFQTRLVLAATLGANYGIYGPAFELCEHEAREPGSEEYLNSEKYEIKQRDLDRPDSLRNLIARINRIRRTHAALQSNESLFFHDVDNDELLCYSKTTADFNDVILVVVNLDPQHVQSGWVDLRLDRVGIHPEIPYQVHDLLTEARYLWHGPRNYVELNPAVVPAHVFLVRRRLRTERQFDYYM